MDRVHVGAMGGAVKGVLRREDARVTRSNALCPVALRAPGFDGKVSQRFVGL